MNKRIRTASLLIVMILASSLFTYGIMPGTIRNVIADEQNHDFSESYFEVTWDFLDFLGTKYPTQQFAGLEGYNVYSVWVSEPSVPFQMLYLGSVNITQRLVESTTMTEPSQVILERYTTPNGTNVVLASSFSMLLIFEDGSGGGKIPNVPDLNDRKWSAITFGWEQALQSMPYGQNIIGKKPYVRPLQANHTGNHYEFGMQYTNLVSMWQGRGSGNVNLTFSRLSELTFIYNMDVNPPVATSEGNATIRMNYRIGEFTDLWLDGLGPGPYTDYYNRTSSQRLQGTGSPPEVNIVDFLAHGQYKLSLMFYQKAVLVSGTASYKDSSGNNVADNNVNATQTTISSYVGGKKMLETGLGVGKVPYQLHDIGGPHSFSSVAYTHEFSDLNHQYIMPSVILALAVGCTLNLMEPRISIEKGVNLMFSTADYIFTVSYPSWGGYRIVHDPYFAVFMVVGQGSAGGSTSLIIIGAAAIGAIVVAVVLLKRRRRSDQVEAGGKLSLTGAI